jgi:RPA family protein
MVPAIWVMKISQEAMRRYATLRESQKEAQLRELQTRNQQLEEMIGEIAMILRKDILSGN